MDIHVVQPGDTIYRLAQQYGVSMERLLQDNQLPDPSHLVVGQTIVVQYPELTHTIQSGDSLYSIAQMHNTTVAQLLRNNPVLRGRDLLFPGQVIVVQYSSQPRGSLTVNAYAYPSINRDLLRATLPYLSQLTPFTYRFDEDDLIPPRDEPLVNAALQSRVVPVLHLSNLDERGQFSGALAHELLEDRDDQRELIEEILETVDRKGYQAVDVDFESLRASDAAAYAQFLALLRQALASRGLPLMAALVPKTSANQPGRLYEGIDYHLIAQSVDFALLMTYGWELLAQPLKTLQIRGLRNNIYTYLQKEIAVVARVMLSDYIYSDTVSQVAFFKIPHQLIDDPKFKQLSIAAKLLYGLLLDRMSLSAQNGWHDNTGRVYIYYTVNDVCQDIGCGRNKAMRLLADLDTVKGIGLIERKKQGQGRPDKIFVKRITVQENAENAPETEQVPTTLVSEADFPDVQRSENPTSRGRKNRPLEVSKANPNKTDENQTNFIQTNLSNYPHTTTKLGWIDRYERKEEENVLEGQQTTADSMLCCTISFRTSYVQNCPTGRNAPDSAACGAVPASMSFVKQTTLVRGHSP